MALIKPSPSPQVVHAFRDGLAASWRGRALDPSARSLMRSS